MARLALCLVDKLERGCDLAAGPGKSTRSHLKNKDWCRLWLLGESGAGSFASELYTAYK